MRDLYASGYGYDPPDLDDPRLCDECGGTKLIRVAAFGPFPVYVDCDACDEYGHEPERETERKRQRAEDNQYEHRYD